MPEITFIKVDLTAKSIDLGSSFFKYRTVLIRFNTAAFITFLAFLMRRLFKGSVYSRAVFISK